MFWASLAPTHYSNAMLRAYEMPRVQHLGFYRWDGLDTSGCGGCCEIPYIGMLIVDISYCTTVFYLYITSHTSLYIYHLDSFTPLECTESLRPSSPGQNYSRPRWVPPSTRNIISTHQPMPPRISQLRSRTFPRLRVVFRVIGVHASYK